MSISVAQDNVYRITGTGNATTDNAIFNEYVARINAAGVRAVIEIDGEVFVTTNKNFTAPVTLTGLRGRVGRINSKVSSGDVFNYNSGFSTSSLTGFTASTPQRFSQYIDVSGFTPTEGGWFLIESDDTVSPTPPPQLGTNGLTSPSEIHQVYEWDAATSRIFLAQPVIDKFQSAALAKAYPMTPLQGIVWADLEFVYSGTALGSGVTVDLLDMRNCTNVLFDNVRLLRNGPGQMTFNYCADLHVRNSVIEGQTDPDQRTMYGFAVASVNGFRMSGCTLSGCRHVFTTSGRSVDQDLTVSSIDTGTDVVTTSSAHGLVNGNVVTINASALPTSTPQVAVDTPYYVISATSNTLQLAETPGGAAINFTSTGTSVVLYREIRWGTSLNCILDDCVINVGTSKVSGSSARIGLDTHPEGYEVEFRNCRINVASDPGNANVGAQTRSRRTIFRNCHFKGSWDEPSGGAGSKAINISGPEAQVLGCTFEGFWQGINIDRPSDGGGTPDAAYANDVVIDRNLFISCKDFAIRNRSAGSRTHITNNTFMDCGRLTSGQRTPIDFSTVTRSQAGTGYVIRGNLISKNGNLYSLVAGDLDTTDVDMEDNCCTGYGSGTVGINHDSAVATWEAAFDGLNRLDE